MQKEQLESMVDSSFLSPSFSTYSSNNLHEIAVQVTKENDNFNSQNDADQNDFEFVAFRKVADGVFFDGSYNHPSTQVFPIFNRDLLTNGHEGMESFNEAEIRIPLGKLLISDEKRGSDPSPAPSESSSEDDLELIPEGSYCVWTPKSPQASPVRCKKSNSTGSSSSSSSSSKRWKFLSLLRRSKSDGKESLVLLTPSSGGKRENSIDRSAVSNIPRVAGKKIPATEKKIPRSALEALYGRKRETKRTSYLPYKQELVGFGVPFNAIVRGSPLHF